MTGAEFDGVDIDLLADYIGGALAGTPDESAVAALVADDPAWREAYESLDGGMALVGAELGRFAPEPMPADLAARLDAMFRTAATPIEVAADDPQPATHPEPIADPVPVPAELAAPPVPHLALVRGDDTAGEAAEPRPERPAPRRLGRRMRWATPIAIAAGVVAFAGFSLDYLAGRHSGDADDSANSTSGFAAESQADAPAAAGQALSDLQLLATGTDYTKSTLAVPPTQPMKAPEEGAMASSKAANPQRVTAGEPSLGRLAAQAALQGCLEAIQRENAGGVISVQTVDFARFNGAPAVVVRFTAANGRWAWASGPACGTPGGDANTLDKVPVR